MDGENRQVVVAPLVEQLASELESRYFDPVLASRIATHLRARVEAVED